MAERTKIRDADLLGDSPAIAPAPEMAIMLPSASAEIITTRTLDRQLLALRKIISPLLAAVMEGRRTSGAAASPAAQIGPFTELIATTVALTQELQPLLDHQDADTATRWRAACGLAEIVAAHFRATAEPLQAAEGGPLIEALSQAMDGVLAEMAPAMEGPRRIDSLARGYKSLAPAVAAVARFSFGRDTLELIEEITGRITNSALDIATRLTGLGDPVEVLESPLYQAVLEVAGEFYLESHFTEMDRLLAMSPEERNEYVKEHARKIPMEPVWESLELKLAMMEVMTAHLPGGKA